MATEEPSLTPGEIQTLKEMANSFDEDTDIDALAQATGTSRRDLLKIAAALGVGSIVGGGSVNELMGEARAAADTTDSDGNVGLPGDRVDVYSDGVDSNSVSTDDVNNIIMPEAGTDLANVKDSDTTIVLRPGEKYTLSQPINTGERAGFTLKGLSYGKDGSGSLINSRPRVEYTGDSAKGPIYLDGSNAISKMLIENVQFLAGGADYGAYIRRWGGESELRDVTFRDFSDTSVAGIDLSDETYGYLRRVQVVEKTANLSNGVYINGDATGSGAVNNLQCYDIRVEMSGSGSGKGIHIPGGTSNVTLYSPMVEGTGQEAYFLSGSNANLYQPYVEQYGLDMTTPVGIEVDTRANIHGGTFSSSVTGGQTIHVASGAEGSLIGGKFSRTEADYHVLSESHTFVIVKPSMTANATVDSVDTQGPLIGHGFSFTAPILYVQNGSWQMEDRDGTARI